MATKTIFGTEIDFRSSSMNRKDSIFGAEPDRLRQLIRSGMDVDDVEAEDNSPASGQVGVIMERPGTRIGCYKLLRILGEGGMGIVYLAEQEQLIRRRVALKIIKPGMDSKRVLARFEAERQALALLDHPNIAQVHDAGTADSGRPYFVMEYVKGSPITEFCDRHTLSIEERLRLFQQVCQAVHHAHQKGIIHRDIKPSNILVTSENDQVIPKIIDFGVAKALIQPLTERTLITEESQLLGTPEYMSPEQIEIANEDIDTRSDIYSMGVLLYELLTGVLPFDSDTLRTGGIEHIRQVIRETDPKTPSTRLTKLGEKAVTVAQNRRTEIGALAKCLHRELEWIPLKAMRKERSERYRSASELSDDIENYLKGEPLMAGPPTAGYRLRKFLRRHKHSVAAAVVVIVSLVLGLTISVAMYLRSEQSREKEAAARAEAEAVIAFIGQDLIGAQEETTERDPTLRYVLDSAAESLEGRFEDYPLVEARLRRMIGGTYMSLGDFETGRQHRERGCQIAREQLGETHPQTFNDTNWLGVAYSRSGRYTEAEALFDRVIQQADRDKSRNHDAWMRWFKCNLANVYWRQGRYQEAEQLMHTMLETDRYWNSKYNGLRIYGHCLAGMYVDLGRYDDAERLYHTTLKLQRDVDGENTGWRAINGLARLYVIQERYDEAEEQVREAQEIGNQLPVSKQHQSHRLYTLHILGMLRREQGRYEDAERHLTEAHDGRKTWHGPDHPKTLESVHELAVLFKEQARYEEAEPLLLEVIKGRRLKLGDQHPHTQESQKNLAELYEAWGKPEKSAQ